MKSVAFILLLILCCAAGVSLALWLETCDLSHFRLAANSSPNIKQLGTDELKAETPQPEFATAPQTSAPVPAIQVTAAEQIVDRPMGLEPPFTQQVDLSPITKSLELATQQQAQVAEQQNKSWDTIGKAIDSFRDLTAIQAQQNQPVIPPAPAAAAFQPSVPVPVEAETVPAQSPRSSRPQIIPEEGDDRLTIVIQDSDIREVLELLSEQGQLNILPTANVQGRVSASLSKVDVPTALAAILRSTGYVMRREGGFIYVGTPEDMLNMDRMFDQVGTRIYRLKYVRAQEIQTLIAPLLTPEVGVISISTASQVGITSDANNSGADDYAGEETVVVRDYEQVLAKIDRAVREIDRRPLQVAIEAMIMSVQLDDSLDIGVSFEALRQNNQIRLISNFPPQDLSPISLVEGGLKLGYLDSNLSLFIEALETVGETNVIAAPQLLVLNKQKAEILIGEQKGYISTTVTESAATQSVEFLEVGTQLRIRPFITDDGIVRMEVHPEISTGDVRVEEGLTIPDKEVTQVTTNIMCPDGRTVVIGGLVKSSQKTNSTQIPFFGSLPGVGLLFRDKSEELEREELIVLITPRIVDPNHIPQDGEQARDLFEIQHEIKADKMSPFGKRHIARKYYRLATAAWAIGDPSKTLRYCNLAIHYDNQHLEAVALREKVITTTGVGDRTIHSHLNEGLSPFTHPGRVGVSPWHLDQIQQQQPPVSPSIESYPTQPYPIDRPAAPLTTAPGT